MTSPSKNKGNGYERELVQHFRSHGIESERAYASNGKALGHGEEVDLLAGGKRIQAKRRKALPSYLVPSDEVDAVVFRRDRGESLVLVKLSEYVDLIRNSME